MSTIDADSDRIEKAQAEPEMGDLLVAYLNQLGVEYVFGVPGGCYRAPLQCPGPQRTSGWGASRSGPP